MIQTILNSRDLGKAFKAERRALRLTQAAVAQAAGYRRETILDLEAGKSVSTQTLFAALAALGKGLRIVDSRLSLDDLSALRDAADEG
jgi:transcriptional regulator with XRE-family HTH domain